MEIFLKSLESGSSRGNAYKSLNLAAPKGNPFEIRRFVWKLLRFQKELYRLRKDFFSKSIEFHLKWIQSLSNRFEIVGIWQLQKAIHLISTGSGSYLSGFRKDFERKSIDV